MRTLLYFQGVAASVFFQDVCLLMAKNSIPVFKTIEELHAVNGVDIPLQLPGFIAFPFSETYPNAKPFMPPYRKSFYQIVLMEKGFNVRFSLNTHEVKSPENIIYFNGPGHVYSYKRADNQEGYIIYFTDEFLSQLVGNVMSEFPFFKVTELNILQLSNEEIGPLNVLFNTIVREQRVHGSGKLEVVRHLVVALLYKVKAIYLAKNNMKSQFSRTEFLMDKFRQLVNNYYVEHKTVEQYADMLSITPGYLSELVNASLGTNPKSIINQRLISEAKNMLRYSDLTVSEIAFQLGFPDPSSFGKFFRKETEVTPSQFRQSIS